MNFEKLRSEADERRESARSRKQADIVFRRRLDPVFLFVVIVFVVACILSGLALATAQTRWGWFDPDPLVPIADERLVDNIRSQEARAGGPIVAAAHLPGIDRVEVLRRDGLLHSYDTTTRLWSDDASLQEGQAGISSPFVDLAPACTGHDETIEDSCVAQDGLFASSALGGLVARQDGHWRTVLSDTRFVGVSGKQVAQDEVVSVAVSGDRRWLLVATRTEGLGLFDLTRRIWHPVEKEMQASLLGDATLPPPTALAAFNATFLIGTRSGLATLTVTGAGVLEAASRAPKPDGAVLDIASSAQETLVLALTHCEGGECLGIYRAVGTTLARVAGEDQIYPQLSSASLARGFLSPDETAIFVLGEAGIYRYDRETRNWSRLSPEAATVFLEAPDVEGIIFASPGKVGSLSPTGRLQLWPLENETIVSLAKAENGLIWIQTASNKTFGWRPENAPVLAVDGAPASVALGQMKRGVSAFGRIILTGTDAVVIHDPAERSYHSIQKAGLGPSQLFQADVRLLGSPRILWAVGHQAVEAYKLDTAGGTPSLTKLGAHPLAGTPLRSARLDGDALQIIDASGSPARFFDSGSQITRREILGPASTRTSTVTDALMSGGKVLLAQGDVVSVYSEQTRGFQAPIEMPIDESIREMTFVGSTLTLLGDGGNIVVPGSDETVTGASNHLRAASDGITDAMREGNNLYLASQNGVDIYSTRSRRITQTYPFQARRDLHLAGITGGVPVTFDGEDAWLGRQSLAIAGADILSTSLNSGTVTTVQKDGRGIFLARHTAGPGSRKAPVCYFANPGPQGANLLDVAALPDGRIAALAGDTLWVRDRDHRRFVGFQIAAAPLPTTARLTLLSDHIVAHDETGAWAVPLDALAFNDSCSNKPVDLRGRTTALKAAAVAVSMAEDNVWTLQGDGTVEAWSSGKSTIIRRPAKASNPAAFQSADRVEDTLVFADPKKLWTYDSRARLWSSRPFETGGPVVHADIWNDGSDLIATLERADGSFLGGPVEPGNEAIRLSALRQDRSVELPFAPGTLRDVSNIGGDQWLFLGSKDMAIVENPDGSRPRLAGSFRFAEQRDDRTVWLQNQNAIIVAGDPERPDRVTLLATGTRGASQTGEQLGVASFVPETGESYWVLPSGNLLRKLQDGRVEECRIEADPGTDANALSNCTQRAGPALLLDQDAVTKAYALSDSDWLLHMADGSLLLIDRLKRSERLVSRDLPPIERIVLSQDHVFILDRERRLLYLDRAQARLTAVAEDVRAIRRLPRALLVQTGTGLAWIDGTERATDPVDILEELRGAPPPGSMSALSLWGDGLSGVLQDEGGARLLSLPGNEAMQLDDILMLPGATSIEGPILQAGPLGNGRWRLRLATQIMEIGRGVCQQPTVEPQTPPSGQSAPGAEATPAVQTGTPAAEAPDEKEAEAEKPQPVSCLIVERQIALPEAGAGPSPVIDLASDGGLTINGSPAEPEDCELVDRDYGEAQPLTGRPQTAACRLDASAVPSNPAVSITAQTLKERSGDLTGAIDDASGQLDPSRFEEQGSRINLMLGAFKLTEFSGSMDRRLAQAAQARSFAWSRDDAAFTFRAHDGEALAIAPEQAMPNGRFAFAAPGRAVMISRGAYLVANRYGTWIYDLAGNKATTWRPVSLPDTSARSARGQVYYSDGSIIGATDTAQTSGDPRVRVSIGRLAVESNPLAAQVSASWSDGVTAHQAFSEAGFLFDRRRDLAVTAAGIWLSTPIGMIDARNFGESAPLPPFAPDRIVSWRDETYAVDPAGRWFRFSPPNWQRVPDPVADREAAREGSHTWAFRGGRLITASPVDGEADRQGLRFDNDVLLDAAHRDDALLIRLADGLRSVQGFNALSNIGSPTHPGLTSARMEVRPLASGAMAIVAVAGDGNIVSRWAGDDFVPIAAMDDPDIARRAADFDWLRVRFDRLRPVTEMSLEDTDGNRAWSQITWSRGSAMPFDRFTAIHGVDGTLYAGTSVGLQILTLSGTDILNQRFVDLRAGGDAFDRVGRIGKSVRNGDDIFVLGERECLSVSGGRLARCNDLRALESEDLGTNAFWRWIREGGRVGFTYLDHAGTALTGLTEMPRRGRFPHDVLDDLASCNGRFQTWDGNFTSLGNGGLDTARTFPIKPGAALQLVCRSFSVPPSADSPEGLPSGLYLSGKDGTWVWSGGGIAPRSALGSALDMRKDGRMPFEARKLRLRNLDRGRGVAFQYRQGDEWRALRTAGGRLAIDQRGGLVRAEGAIWAFTPEGFVRIDEKSGGLDPDTVLLAPVVPESQSACRFDAAETADGSASFIPVPADGVTTFLRCADGRLFTGRLDAGSEARDFAPVAPSGDPFIQRVIHEDEVLKLARGGRIAGRSGSLDFGWRGEPNPLSGGRTALDDVKEIALVEDGIIDMVTALGWVRQDRDDFSDSDVLRPVNRAGFAQTGTALAKDVDSDRLSDLERADRVSLCLTTSAGDTARWFANGDFRSEGGCADFLGFDGTYAYRQTRDGVAATARGLDGTTTSRSLVDGRFSDNEMFGQAVLARHDGLPVIAIASRQKVVMFDAATLDLLGAWSWPETPTTLYLSSDGRIVVASGESTEWLETKEAAGCAGLSNLEQSFGATILGVDRTEGRMHARLMVGGLPADVLFSCDNEQLVIAGDFAPTAERARYRSNFVRWGEPRSGVELVLDGTGDVVTLFGDELKKQATLSTPWLFNRFIEDRFFLVNPNDVFEADVDAVMSAMERETAN